MNAIIVKALSELANIRKIAFNDETEVIVELHGETEKTIMIANPVKYLPNGAMISYCERNQIRAILDKGYIFAVSHPDSSVKEHYVRHVVEKSLEA
jgi:hypothetical protein